MILGVGVHCFEHFFSLLFCYIVLHCFLLARHGNENRWKPVSVGEALFFSFVLFREDGGGNSFLGRVGGFG